MTTITAKELGIDGITLTEVSQFLKLLIPPPMRGRYLT
jgi:hypothetical protein